MTTPHPHKDILIAIANGFPIEQVESQHKTWKKTLGQKQNLGIHLGCLQKLLNGKSVLNKKQ